MLCCENRKELYVREFQRFRDEERVVKMDRVGVGEARDKIGYRRFLIIRNRDEF